MNILQGAGNAWRTANQSDAFDMFGNYIASKMKAIKREIISAIEENHTKFKGVFNPIARYLDDPAAPYKSQIQALSQLPLCPEQLLKLIIYSWINLFFKKIKRTH